MNSRIVLFSLLIFLLAGMPRTNAQLSGENTAKGVAASSDSYSIDGLEAPQRRYESDRSIPTFTDEEYRQRIENISGEFPMRFNKIVRSYILAYTVKRRSSTEKIIGRSVIYFPIFEQALRRYNIPSDLKHLAIVESALRPNAVSPAGATGLWQFMHGTGTQYKLKVNQYVDERSDPYMSSEAAARFLSDLFDRYHDWPLAIAAYNCGPGRVNKAIRRGGKKDFWQIYKFLPRETRNYVPAFISAAYVMNYYHLHNLSPEYPDYDIQITDKVRVYNRVSFNQIATSTGTPIETVKFLNPAFKQDFIPASSSGYILALPLSKMPNYRAMDPTATSVSYATLPIRSFEDQVMQQNNSTTTSYTEVETEYVVRRGDNLGKIARAHRCSVKELRKWNKISGSQLKIGQKLKILEMVEVPSSSINTLDPNAHGSISKPTPSTTTPVRHYSSTVSTTTDVAHATSVVTKYTQYTDDVADAYVYYEVQQGDILWDIASKYPSVTITDIMKLNGLSFNSEVRPGTKIKITRKN